MIHLEFTFGNIFYQNELLINDKFWIINRNMHRNIKYIFYFERKSSKMHLKLKFYNI